MAANRDTVHADVTPNPRTRATRVRLSVALSLLGLTMITLGLAIDFVLHANDPNLAAVEGLFTISNPGHVLLGLGIAAAAVGLGLAAWSMISAGAGETQILRITGFAAAFGVVILVGAVAYIAAGPGFGHDHGDGATVAHDEHDPDSAEAGEGGDSSRIPRDEGLALSTLAWSGSSSLDEGDAHEHGAETVGIDELTPEERDDLEEQFEAAAEVVTRYASVDQALADGYSRSSFRVDGVGFHFTKWSLVDQPFDPANPSQLLYEEVTFGQGLELVGLSYWAASEHEPEGFAGNADGWHQHRGSCFINGTIIDENVPDRDSCTGDWINGSNLWMVHAWVVPGMENDLGVFQTANRRICERICGAEN